MLMDAQGTLVKWVLVEETVPILAAADTTATVAIIPGNTGYCMGVSSKVIVQPPGTATYSIGVATATTRYGGGASTAVGTFVHGFSSGGILAYSPAAAILITPNATPSDATGRIHVSIWMLTPVSA
jgi:hypothetical protein